MEVVRQPLLIILLIGPTIPFKLEAFIDAPKLMSSLMTMSCPFKQATCNGVLPWIVLCINLKYSCAIF